MPACSMYAATAQTWRWFEAKRSARPRRLGCCGSLFFVVFGGSLQELSSTRRDSRRTQQSAVPCLTSSVRAIVNGNRRCVVFTRSSEAMKPAISCVLGRISRVQYPQYKREGHHIHAHSKHAFSTRQDENDCDRPPQRMVCLGVVCARFIAAKRVRVCALCSAVFCF